jgi:hypothetical protein
MPANGTKTAQPKATTDSKPTAKRASRGTEVRENLTKVRADTVARVRQTTERAVDLPVGVALVAADRVNGLVEPWTSNETRETELKSFRQRVERELNKFERRGGTARRKATRRVRTTRGRFERQLKQRRRSVEAAVKENRSKAQDGLRKAQTAVQERFTALV